MEFVKLSNIATINAGGTPSRSKSKYWNGNIPWLKISDIKSKYTNLSTEFITEEGLNNSSAKYFDENTVLYTIFATVGEVSILNFKSTTNQAIAGIKLINNNYITEYLYFYLRSIKNKVKFDSKGVAQNNINLAYLKNLDIPVITIEKQYEIVRNLNEIEELIEKNNSILLNLDNIVKSQFIEMFGTLDLSEERKEWVEIKDVSKIHTGTTPSTTDETNWDGDILWITPAEMNSKTFYVHDTVRKITEKGKKSKSLDLMPVNTVLLSTRAPIGKVGIVGVPMTCNQGFKNFECCDKLNSIYLYTLLKNNTEYLNSLGSGTTFLEVSKSTISKLRIPLPDIKLQNKFADFVQLIDKSKLNKVVSHLMRHT